MVRLCTEAAEVRLQESPAGFTEEQLEFGDAFVCVLCSDQDELM